MTITKMLKKLLILVFIIVWGGSYSQNQNLQYLLNSTKWNTLFPNRVGVLGNHPQGYTQDFYSFDSLVKAVDEMADYSVTIKFKEGIWGQWIAITKLSTNTTYDYSQVDQLWHSNPAPITSIQVDFNTFLNTSDSINNKRELAAFLAHISKETTGGWQTPVGSGSQGDYASWGLYFVHELGYNSTNSTGVYSQAHPEFPPNPSVGYYGRGPIQLSWNYNYGHLSKFLFNDKNVLLNNPNLLQENSTLAFKSAIWFWMMPQCPKPSCHQVMHNLWTPKTGLYTSMKMYKIGFAHTNNIINGGLECRSSSVNAFTQKVVLRSELYKYYLGALGFNTYQITQEDSGAYSTLCYESSSNAMEDYQSCNNMVSQNNIYIEDLNILIYPNPTSKAINIIHDEIIDRLEINNILGQKVFDSFPNSKNVFADLSFLPNGIYFIKMYANTKWCHSKLWIIK